MEDIVFHTAFNRFRDEINITNLLKEIRVLKAAVQSKLTEEQWKDIKKKHAIKPLWIKKQNKELMKENKMKRPPIK